MEWSFFDEMESFFSDIGSFTSLLADLFSSLPGIFKFVISFLIIVTVVVGGMYIAFKLIG